MGEMISLIAHQWRQPLNVIGVMVQSFQDAWEFDELTGEFIDQQVDIVMNQIQYMSDTITDFRDFFKPEMAQIFDIREAINKAIHLLGYVFKKYEIKLEKHLEEGCLLNGVPNDLVQVFLNIINNAQQAMRTAEIEYPMVRISMKKAQDNVVIKLFNIGTKIEDDNIDKLFEPYFTSKGENGTGIGLYICRKIIENKYQGSITANNTDSGVEFIITLPCVTEI
jgi:signal transduction histidine kinase